MSFGILLDNPKYPHHVGQAIRLAACYGGQNVLVFGERCKDEVDRLRRIPREERMRDYAHVELLWMPSTGKPLGVLRSRLGADISPVCVEVDSSAESLPHFVHPYGAAVYVFGPEDGSVRQGLRHACHRFVTIPTKHCLNLGHAMATVLYDRTAKIGAHV